MNDRPSKPAKPGRPQPKQAGTSTAPPASNALLQAGSRWQRAVRYGWDKGGSHGGRK